MTPEQIDRFAAHGWITGRGDGSSERHHPRLTKKDCLEYKQAKADKYLIGGSENDLRDLWFLCCEELQWPYIVVSLGGGKYASLVVDFITMTDRRVERIFEMAWQLVQSHADALPKKKTRLSGGDIRFRIRRDPQRLRRAARNGNRG